MVHKNEDLVQHPDDGLTFDPETTQKTLSAGVIILGGFIAGVAVTALAGSAWIMLS